MAQDMIKLLRVIANISILFVIIGILAISIAVVYGSDAPVSREASIPVQIQGTQQISADIDEDFKWVDVFFRGESAPDDFLAQQVTITLQNTGSGHNLITAPLIATAEESAALVVKPGEKREVFRGRLGDLIDKTYDCPDKSRKKGIGVSAFQNPMVRARVEIVFKDPQKPADLNRVGMSSWWFSPGEA